jgi:hypothetical protein
MNIEILEEAASIKKSYDSARNMESMWTMKQEVFWRDRYNSYLSQYGLTDLDVSKYLYPASY